MDASERKETLNNADPVLSSLSRFIDPLITVTNHPLLNNVEFYNFSEILLPKLDEKIATLWNSAIFKGCCLIADTKAMESEGSVQSTAAELVHPIPQKFYWLREDQVTFTLDFLLDCKKGVENSSLKDRDIQQCEKIYLEVQEYLQVLQPIFKCPVFKNRDFHFALNVDPNDNPELANKLEKLFLACITAQDGASRGSRRNTPIGTPQASPLRQSSFKSRQTPTLGASSFTPSSLTNALKQLKETDETEKHPPEDNMMLNFLVNNVIAPSVGSLLRPSPQTHNGETRKIEVLVVPNTDEAYTKNPHFEGEMSEEMLARENIFAKVAKSKPDAGLCGCIIL